jgi:hypothetical protein
MRRLSIAQLLILMTLPTITAAEPRLDITKLGWLEGTWSGVTSGVAMEETWSSARGGGLVGMHKDSRSGKMTSYEFFRVVPNDSGGVCYIASLPGQAPTPFCAIELSESKVVFENREHDFPQRVLYWLERDGRLHARIEGTIHGATHAEDWVWNRSRGK